MGERLLLVNPKKPPSKRKKATRKKPRSAAQKAATRKMLAANKRRRNPKKGAVTMAKRTRKRRSAAQKAATRRLVAFNRRGGRKAPAKRRRRRNQAAAPAARPRRRTAYRRAYQATAPRRRRRNPVRRRGMQGILNNLVMPAASAASGALAIDVLWANLPIPEEFKVGQMRHVVKAAGAIGLAMMAEMVVTKKTADAMGIGALTVVFHQAAREFIATTMPQLRMDGIGYYNPALPAGNLAPNQLGYYADASGNANDYGGGVNNEAAYNNGMGFYAT